MVWVWVAVYTVFLVPRSEVAEREQVLRTRAMREREEMRAVVRHYRYTLLRVRMPDGLLLQGKVSSCRQFMMPLITKYLYHSLNGTLVCHFHPSPPCILLSPPSILTSFSFCNPVTVITCYVWTKSDFIGHLLILTTHWYAPISKAGVQRNMAVGLDQIC